MRTRSVPASLPVRLVGLLAAFMLAVVGCSADDGEETDGDEAAGAGGGGDGLAGVCPDTVVAQTSWWLQIEHFVAFQLLGEGWEPDADAKSVTGPLVAGGEDTGVDIEIRAGGPAIGFEKVSARMYLDDDITFGLVPIDESIQLSADQPVTAVMAPFDLDPQVIAWSPEEHLEWNTIVDIGQSDETVVYAESVGTYMEYLVGSGILRREQVDASFDGSHDRFVASGGTIATQEFATSGPYRLENEIEAWGRPIEYQYIHDTGYPNYRHAVSVRADELEDLSPCLEALVPILQQASVDFMADPDPTIELVDEVREETGQEDADSVDRARYAVDVMRDDGIVSGGSDGTVGNFDMDRVQQVMDIVQPIFAGQNIDLKEDLSLEDIATNEFIDDSIELSASS